MSQHPDFKNLFVSSHPLILDKLSHMREKSCAPDQFRRLLRTIGRLMAYEVISDLELANNSVETPMRAMAAPFLSSPPPAVIPVLRAGLGMSDGVLDILEDSPVGHIGLYRDEISRRPVEYLVKLPPYHGGCFIVVDPMLATGHSASYACECVRNHGVIPERIILLSLVAVPEGVCVMEKAHPNVKIYTASLDERLDENAYILPGLGDAGDRMFGT